MLAGNLDHEIGIQEVYQAHAASTFSNLDCRTYAATPQHQYLSRLRHIATLNELFRDLAQRPRIVPSTSTSCSTICRL